MSVFLFLIFVITLDLNYTRQILVFVKMKNNNITINE